jgi:hypothetical protein
VVAASGGSSARQGPRFTVPYTTPVDSNSLRRHGRPTQEEKATLADRKADGLLPGPGGVRTTLALRDLFSVSATVPFAIAGISVVAQAGGGLYWALAGVLGAYLAAMYGAWVLVIEIRR